MGAEFIRDAAASFKKGWDRGLVKLGTADLFTQQPTCAPRVVDADLVGDASIRAGEYLVIRKVGDRLVAARGLSEVAHLTNPPADVLSAVEASCGVAKGLVEHVHDDARVAEIAIC